MACFPEICSFAQTTGHSKLSRNDVGRGSNRLRRCVRSIAGKPRTRRGSTNRNAGRIWPLFEAAEAMGVPIITHTGWSMFPKGKMLAYDYPLYLEDVMVDFPNLKLVIGHVGFAWAEETMHFMAKFEHIYGDFAFWAESAPLWRVAQIWTWAKKLGVFNRFLWGTDYPYVPFDTGKEFFGRVREYTERHDMEPFITESDEQSFFGGAAVRLLGLPEAVPYAGHSPSCP